MQTDAGAAYLHGANSMEQARLLRRTAASSAAFLLPQLQPGWELLDCGCGVGSITCDFAKVVAPGHAFGLDTQGAQIERARRLAVERGAQNVNFDIGSVYDLPYPDGKFDAVFANTLFQHLKEPGRALAEIRRVLKSGGLVAIADDDHGTVLWEPRTPALTEALSLIARVIAHNGGDVYRARHHPRLLLEAGFVRVTATATLGTGGVWGSPEETRLFAAWFADQLRAAASEELMIGQGWTDAESLKAIIGDVLAWGERPDAFFAVVGVAATGWLD
ncbi:MAG: methyltransferase domain-containing protein [Chloroflexi bacterium]|nr:methyltransferase domain-containing protein [Chloroflexota bacterium]